MLKNKLIRIFLGSLCVLGLVLTRGFEDDLFYDPLKYFFKGYHKYITEVMVKLDAEYFDSMLDEMQKELDNEKVQAE
jgi:exosortase F-associated protein